jgi:hypothetical protein
MHCFYYSSRYNISSQKELATLEDKGDDDLKIMTHYWEEVNQFCKAGHGSP